MKKKKYNLIEIALAMGVLAIGITAIVSLFPLGLKEIKDSIGENYSSQAADSMLAFIAREAYNDWNILDNIPTSKPSTVLTSTTGWVQLEGDIYNPNAGNNGIYGLKITSGEGSIADFTGEVLLWKSKIKNISVVGGTIDELNYSKAAALHLEVSWPVEKPYASRRKSSFCFELFNYNQ
jgi:hypothetical protein